MSAQQTDRYSQTDNLFLKRFLICPFAFLQTSSGFQSLDPCLLILQQPLLGKVQLCEEAVKEQV